MQAPAQPCASLTPPGLPWPADAPSSGERRACFAPMTEHDLDTVRAVEVAAYAHPWSLKHFADSLASGYAAILLLGESLPGEVVHPVRADGRVETLDHIGQAEMAPGDIFEIHTPGGGGFGPAGS